MAALKSGGDRSHDARHHGHENALSIVAPGMKVVGELVTDGVVKIEGVVEGSIRADHEVLVAKDGLVQGDIETRQAVIGGRVVGSILAHERVEVQPDSVVQGDIMTRRLVVHEGGEVNGHVRMGDVELKASEGAVLRVAEAAT
jgi:cytoskeletal protein CcmA (bactofilin family)